MATLLLGAASAHAAFPGQNGKIAFTSFAGSGCDNDVWTMNPDGTGATNLTHSVGRNEELAAWSSDGTELVFRRNGATECQFIYSTAFMDADGSNVRPGPQGYGVRQLDA